jgi:nucleotide-binding universal stress UspA family protein
MTTPEEHPQRRIVVGVDGSEHSKQALRWAASLAAQSGATVDAVMAWEFPTSMGWSAGTYVPDTWNPESDAEQALATAIDDVFGSERPAGLRPILREGNASKALLELSEGATMLVVGSRGHSGLTGRLVGSAAADCTQHASCPVLVVHGEEPP